MIALTFHSLMQRSPIVFTSAEGFRVFGTLLTTYPENTLIARFSAHHWEVRGQRTSSFECTDRCTLRFETANRSSEPLGPFNTIRFPNGSCYADLRLLATLVPESEQWRNQADGSLWDALVISP